jgi:hypothetical protein
MKEIRNIGPPAYWFPAQLAHHLTSAIQELPSVRTIHLPSASHPPFLSFSPLRYWRRPSTPIPVTTRLIPSGSSMIWLLDCWKDLVMPRGGWIGSLQISETKNSGLKLLSVLPTWCRFYRRRRYYRYQVGTTDRQKWPKEKFEFCEVSSNSTWIKVWV